MENNTNHCTKEKFPGKTHNKLENKMQNKFHQKRDKCENKTKKKNNIQLPQSKNKETYHPLGINQHRH